MFTHPGMKKGLVFGAGKPEVKRYSSKRENETGFVHKTALLKHEPFAPGTSSPNRNAHSSSRGRKGCFRGNNSLSTSSSIRNVRSFRNEEQGGFSVGQLF